MKNVSKPLFIIGIINYVLFVLLGLFNTVYSIIVFVNLSVAGLLLYSIISILFITGLTISFIIPLIKPGIVTEKTFFAYAISAVFSYIYIDCFRFGYYSVINGYEVSITMPFKLIALSMLVVSVFDLVKYCVNKNADKAPKGLKEDAKKELYKLKELYENNVINNQEYEKLSKKYIDML